MLASRLKEFADNNFELDEHGRKSSTAVENILEKGEIRSFSCCVFKRLILQTRKNKGLVWERIKVDLA